MIQLININKDKIDTRSNNNFISNFWGKGKIIKLKINRIIIESSLKITDKRTNSILFQCND